MPAPAQPVSEAQDFPGMLSNVDPRDIPAGAAEEQVNICSIVQGELRVRLGIREVVFEASS
jgi:hypothetical protein